MAELPKKPSDAHALEGLEGHMRHSHLHNSLVLRQIGTSAELHSPNTESAQPGCCTNHDPRKSSKMRAICCPFVLPLLPHT